MPRLLRRAAVLGLTAHAAAKHGEARGAAAAAAAPAPRSESAPLPAQDPAPAPDQDRFDELMKLKQLLDAGVLTQGEFDAEKQKILDS
jgi:hypothetical protein